MTSPRRKKEKTNAKIGNAVKYEVHHCANNSKSVVDCDFEDGEYQMKTDKPACVNSEGAISLEGDTDTGLWGGVEIYPLYLPIFERSVIHLVFGKVDSSVDVLAQAIDR